jgi:ribosome modulation factor
MTVGVNVAELRPVEAANEGDARKPVSDLATLNQLDERDILAGYFAGLDGDGHEPSLEFNRSYWHGWRNGMMDRYRMKPDAASAALAHEFVEPAKIRSVG